MRVTVLYFATLRQRAGIRQEVVDLPEGASVADLRAHLGKRGAPLREALPAAVVAVNREFAQPDTVLRAGDEVAIFPPVSGGGSEAHPTILHLTDDPLDLNQMLQLLVQPTTGAACVFTGVVRARTERGEPHTTGHLEYQAYGPMAEAMLGRVAEEIRSRWPAIEGIAIVQRLGRLDPGTPTVLVACTAAHRETGVFEAARYGIDRLKQIVPIWKKDVGPEGERWVEGDYYPGEAEAPA
jgi:molybdopterin converting factor subunit 1